MKHPICPHVSSGCNVPEGECNGACMMQYPGGKACRYCGCKNDLRPYGPSGSMVCFDCAMSTPERKAETKRNFAMQLDAIQGPSVIDGSEAGPYPAEHHPHAKTITAHLLQQEGEKHD